MFSKIIDDAKKDFIEKQKRGNWLSEPWRGRLASKESPQNYIDLDIQGYSTSINCKIWCTLSLRKVGANETVEIKDLMDNLTYKVDVENFEADLNDVFLKIRNQVADHVEEQLPELGENVALYYENMTRKIMDNVQKEINTEQQSLSGTWRGRLASKESPQNYIDLEISGYSDSSNQINGISCTLTKIRENEVVEIKDFSCGIYTEIVESNLFEQFLRMRYEVTDYVEEQLPELGENVTSYSHYEDKTIGDHFKLLEEKGFSGLPDYSKYIAAHPGESVHHKTMYMAFVDIRGEEHSDMIGGSSPEEILQTLRERAEQTGKIYDSCNIGVYNPDTDRYQDFKMYDVQNLQEDLTKVYFETPDIDEETIAIYKENDARLDPQKKKWYITVTDGAMESFQNYLSDTSEAALQLRQETKSHLQTHVKNFLEKHPDSGFHIMTWCGDVDLTPKQAKGLLMGERVILHPKNPMYSIEMAAEKLLSQKVENVKWENGVWDVSTVEQKDMKHVRDFLGKYPDSSFHFTTAGGYVDLTPKQVKGLLMGESVIAHPGNPKHGIKMEAEELLSQRVENVRWENDACYVTTGEEKNMTMEQKVVAESVGEQRDMKPHRKSTYIGYAYRDNAEKPQLMFGSSPDEILQKLGEWNQSRPQESKYKTCNIGIYDTKSDKYQNFERYNIETGKSMKKIYLQIPKNIDKEKFKETITTFKENGAKFDVEKKQWYITDGMQEKFKDYLSDTSEAAESKKLLVEVREDLQKFEEEHPPLVALQNSKSLGRQYVVEMTNGVTVQIDESQILSDLGVTKLTDVNNEEIMYALDNRVNKYMQMLEQGTMALKDPISEMNAVPEMQIGDHVKLNVPVYTMTDNGFREISGIGN